MSQKPNKASPPIRWWPGALLVLSAIILIGWVRFQGEWAFQKRNLTSAQIAIVTGILLAVWWTFFSRAPNRLRLGITFSAVAFAIAGAALFRIRGMSGDMLPILEFRWSQKTSTPAGAAENPADLHAATELPRPDFPQFLGPNRDGVLAGPPLESNWPGHPPEILWRRSIGAGWSGFAVVGTKAITQEQRGKNESVVAYDLFSGAELWVHSNQTLYQTVIAGTGPRATPNIVSNRVFACGGTGILNCLDLATGKLIWTRDLIAEFAGTIPQWGYACSPLLVEDSVVVHAGEGASVSLLAFHGEDGKLLWTAGAHGSSYASPLLAFLAGVPQILAFNDGSVSAHDPDTGKTLWEKPWGNGNVVCASPVVASTNRVLFSSGYGVGATLFEISSTATQQFEARVIWKSIRMKSKFAHLFAREGSLYGLDDGIFACVNLADGSQRWKEGRYGHGQGLLVGDLYLLMAESGELILLRPTPEAPNELARFRVFNSKTWNPMALSGDLLLVRNDQEVACLRLPLQRAD